MRQRVCIGGIFHGESWAYKGVTFHNSQLPFLWFLFIYLFIFLFKFYFIFKLYIIVLVLPNIKMNLPQVYMCFSTFHNSVVFPLISLKRFSLKFSNQPWLISFHYLMCWAICCSDTFILYQMEVWNMIWEP